MIKCPFCQFDNEDGALFCEQCKSDLGGMEAAPVAEAIAVSEPVPMAAEVVAEAVPVAPVMAEPVPVAAEVVEAAPVAEAVSVSPPPPPAPVVDAPPAPSPVPAATAAEAGKLPAGAQPKLVVLRGLKINSEYPLYEGHNFIGRADEKPVDIDLDDQEPPDRIWSSRQHALINFADGQLTIEDLNSSNGTFVNRTRVYPGQPRVLNANDVIQIGTVQMKVKV